VDETYRRDIKGIRNLQEGRHALARKICHGKKGELYHRYERGLEDQVGTLGLVLNCVTLWTTLYLDAAVRQLMAQDYPVRDEDMARLSPFVNTHLGVHGTYSFLLPDLAPRHHPRAARPGRHRRRRRVTTRSPPPLSPLAVPLLLKPRDQPAVRGPSPKLGTILMCATRTGSCCGARPRDRLCTSAGSSSG